MRYYLIVILDDNGDYIFRLDTSSFAELISINKNNLNYIIEITELSKGD